MRKSLFAALGVFLFVAATVAQAGWPASMPPEEYAARRAKLMAAHPDALIVIYARNEAPAYAEGGFRQDKNFYYLTGRDDFGAVLVLDAPGKQCWLFPPEGVRRGGSGSAPLFGGREESEEGEGANPLAGLLGVVVAPLAAALVQMSISRAREFLADESAAHYTGDPLALASAAKALRLKHGALLNHGEHGEHGEELGFPI
jgi:hypothetical protein